MKNTTFATQKEAWSEKLHQRNRNQKWVSDRLFALDYPGLYLGDEMNTFHFDWDLAVCEKHIDQTFKVCLSSMMVSGLCFSAPALSVFYDLLHSYNPSWVVERTLYPPTQRNMQLMKEDGILPFSVESKMPLTAFDCLYLSMDLSGSAAGTPWILLESGIPVFSRDRGETDPFVVLGGTSLVNPGPFQPFCDILVPGESEDILPELLSLLEEGKQNGLSRDHILLNAAQKWDCVYVPCFYKEHYKEDGRYAGTVSLRSDVPDQVRFCRVKDLDQVFVSTSPYQDFCTNTMNTSHYEISRGCKGKCAFCMSGYTSLPFRIRSTERIRQAIGKMVQNTGNTAFTPLSFNSLSHPQINQIIRSLNFPLGDQVRLASTRLNALAADPELSCFISMQEKEEITFGIEGASQRLRDLFSVNLSEQQILDSMRLVCRDGYQTVKFMMIAGLPTESGEDLEELYQLAVKIRDIFEEETSTESPVPRLLITWIPLLINPHTPLQWASVPQILPEKYEDFSRKIQDLGFRSTTPRLTSEYIMNQLLLRGDERLADLLLYLAREGEIHCNDDCCQDAGYKMIRFLSEHGLPPVSEWFREYRLEDPLPWNIVESPVSTEVLWQRYQTTKVNVPVSDPVCSAYCGSCDSDRQERISELFSLREENRKMNLHYPGHRTTSAPVQYVLLQYDYDYMHSIVIPSYWDCELRRALYHAGISFDPSSIESFGSKNHDEHAAAGFNSTCITLSRHYDLEDFKEQIEAHAVNFRIRQIQEIPRPLRVQEVTYRMRLPEVSDPEQIAGYLQERLKEETWTSKADVKASACPCTPPPRSAVRRLDIDDNHLLITMGPHFADPRLIFRYLFQIPQDQPLGQMPERTGFIYENQGILDRCMSYQLRSSFLINRDEKPGYSYKKWDHIVNYISSDTCVRDMERLIRRDYFMAPPFHHKIPKNLSGRMRHIYCWKGSVNYLLKLASFALRDFDYIYSDGVYSFRTSRTAQDFLRRLRDNKDCSSCYILKADVSNYVGSIVPEKLIPRLEQIWDQDPALLDLMKYILLRRECIEPDGETVSCEPGGLGGIPLANVFMNTYLMDLDDYFYSRAPLYCRYSDDIIIFARNQEEADDYRNHFLQILKEKDLSTNSEKTYLIEPGGEVEILGCKLKNGKLDISDHAKKKLKRKIRMHVSFLLRAKREQGLTDEECGRRMAKYCNTVFFGLSRKNELTWARWLFPIITETASLKELDHFVQDAIRRCMCGTLSKKRYRISYQQLKALGYKNLVHSYYHFDHTVN